MDWFSLELSWKNIFAGGGLFVLAQFLWNLGSDIVEGTRQYFTGAKDRRVEEKRIQSEEDKEIYNQLAERVERLTSRLDKFREELDETKDKYYNLKITKRELENQNEQIREQNRLLKQSNRQLQAAITILKAYVQRLTDRLSEHEAVEGLPDIETSPLNIDSINLDLVDHISDPDVDTPLDQVFEDYDRQDLIEHLKTQSNNTDE